MSCFDVADVLVSDVSSVLSEFLATGRPYVVCNTSGMREEEFVALAPSARAALVLGPDADFARVARLARGEEPDDRATDRLEVRAELLGRADVPATARFTAAVTALVERAAVGRAASGAAVTLNGIGR